MATLQERFNHLFLESTLTQKEFGESFGASADQVYNWRHGRGEPDSETIKLIANARNVSVEYLLGISNERRPGSGVQAIDDPEVIEFMKTVTGEFRLDKNISDKEKQIILEDLADYFRHKLEQRKRHRTQY